MVVSATWVVAQCDECGGAIAFDPEHALVRCLFCAAVALRPVPALTPPPPPAEVVPFALDAAAAQAAFARWVRASWWRPRALHGALAALQPVWIPAWRIDADVELHWAGLARAPTRSGKRPESGVDRRRADVVVPASGAVTLAELTALRPFPADSRPWSDADREIPCELPALTEAGAIAAGRAMFLAEALRAASRAHALVDAGGTAALQDVTARLDALPLWVGSFRYRDRPWRVVVNAATGQVEGRAPLSRLKVALAIAVLCVVALVVARCHDAPEPDPDPERQRLAQAHWGSSASHGTTANR